MTIDKSKFISMFLVETEGYLNLLNEGLVKLEQEAENTTLLGDLFRAAHTLKGSAKMMGFQSISQIAHTIEELFGLLKEKKLKFKSKIANPVFAALDLIKIALKNISLGKEEGIQTGEVCGKLEAILTTTLSDPVIPAQAVPRDRRAEIPHVPLDQGTPHLLENEKFGEKKNLKMEFDAPEKIHDAAMTQSTPPRKQPQNSLEGEVPFQDRIGETTQNPILEEYMPVPVSRVNHLLNLIGEMVVHQINNTYRGGLLKKLVQQICNLEKMFYELESLIKQELAIPDELLQHEGIFLRASQEMEKAAPLLGQLHTIESLVTRFHGDLRRLSDDTQHEIFHMNPLIENLQQKMKDIRMLPCSTLFEGFPRLIRDIAEEQHKKAHLVIEGGETELDKKVLESLKGPLIHLLRNAIDHGIEIPEKRLAVQKQENGTITLSAHQQGGKVILSIRDDGKGINLESIKQIALKKNLVTAEHLSEMDDETILLLIFTEGFSTAPMITDVSGRGVGLSVVQTELNRLKARIIVESKPEIGTTFRIELPLTLAVLQTLLVEAGGFRWGFPMLGLEECLKISLKTVSSLDHRKVIQTRGKSVPIVALSEVLGIEHLPKRSEPPETESAKQSDEATIVVVDLLGKRIGFIIDRILGEQEVFIKNIGSHLKEVKGVGGVTVLANGEVIAILNISDLVIQAQSIHLTRQVPEPTIHQKIKKKILVVEDSLITRELEKTILENNGYEVETAIDGLDALEKLTLSPFDCVVSDIQMPRMDGFELCKNIKTNEKLKSLPVVFVTALSKEDEKRKGIEIGAQAYLVKSQFDQKNLLATLERLI